MPAPAPPPLKIDEKRVAVDSMRGYSYQILRTIEAWIDLADGELLVIEGAEDLDGFGESGVFTTEQIKDTAGSGNVTLRSESVLEAIGNLWGHLERNKGATIHFRLLTTSGVGRERSRPLGFDQPGLKAWSEIREAPTDTDSLTKAAGIKAFLETQKELPEKMRDWLARVSTQEFVERIVVPLDWVTGWPEWSDLFDTVLAKLVELADSRDISPSDAGRALDALHTEAWRIGTSKGSRTLRRGDLLRIVHDASTTAVPNNRLLALLSTITGAPAGGSIVTAAPQTFGMAPRAALHRHARPKLEHGIHDELSGGTVLIHGGTGMGKTGLALSATGRARPVVWVDFRGVPIGAAASTIDRLVVHLPQVDGPRDVVLDDLPSIGDDRPIEAPIGRLRAVQDGLGGTLLVTSSGVLPARIAAQLLLHPSRVVPAPSFSERDVYDYIVARGCSTSIATSWSKIISLSTSGHPQLVDARVAALVEAGFPEPDLMEVMAPPPAIRDVRAEARRLVSTLPADDRELLARVSLLIGRVARARLMAVARIDPPIAEPGDVIDRLTGPWLERTGNEDLRPSPLLNDLGGETRGQEWTTAMHAGIAASFLRPGGILATDILSIATHAMIGRTAASLVMIIPGLMQAGPEVWSQVAESASVLPYLGLTDAAPLPFEDPNETAAFRVLQLRIAIENGKEEEIAKVVERSLHEFDAVDASLIPGPGLFELVFLWQLMQRPGDLPLADRVRLSLRFVRVGEAMAAAFRAMERLGDMKDMLEEWPDVSAAVPMALIPAVGDVDELDEMLDLMESLDPADRAVVLGGYAGDNEGAALAMDRVWLGEAQRDEPRWGELATALRRVIAMSEELEVPGLASAAAPLLVRVLDENVRDRAAALTAADDLIDRLGRLPRVLTAKAKVLWRGRELPEALALYDEALPAFPLGLSWRSDVLREASVAAGRAEDWPLAASRMADALANLSAAEPLVRRVGFLFDLAIALHLSGRKRQAVDRLGQAIDLMVEDGAQMPPEPLLSVRQLGSQAIKTIGAESSSDGIWGDNTMPLPNIFGSPSAMEELTWNGQRAASLDLVVLLMADLDLLMSEPPTIASRLAARLRASTNLMAQSTQGDLLTRLSIRTLDVGTAVVDVLREGRALTQANAENAKGVDVSGVEFQDMPGAGSPSWTDLVQHRLLARIVAMVAGGRTLEIPVDLWIDALPTDGSLGDVLATLEDLRGLLNSSTAATSRIMGGNASWDRHLLAVLLAPVGRHLSPEQLLACHVIAATYLQRQRLAEFTGLPFSEMVTTAWLDRCDSPAQLVTPRLSIPAIRSAATTTRPGWPRVLAILEAARTAISSPAAAGLREVLQSLREKIGPSAAETA
ncbi:hypothetical protein [Sphingomonas sp. PP-CE-1G-424]|uniref:hypothetical protein n=1 Tax=Sphingomonas sp. PP-CE-1G-424 TaxID=2135658 RepID=UPI0010544E3A|nr:hypothetical protein [Sphingomonas sp. PP-CE-1G-424]TCP65406.1 hypothetical protein C8J43_11262 [Sphingomonas sp. PP-CE-1G-424]